MKKDRLIILLGIALVCFLILDGIIDTLPSSITEPGHSLQATQRTQQQPAPSTAETAASAHTESTGAAETTEAAKPAVSNRHTTEPVSPPATQPAASPTEPTPVYGVYESYFNDALFIGDSLTVGLRDNARLGNADYFCQVGIGVFSLSATTASDRNFPEQSLRELLSSRTYGKIYFSLGINDAGYDLGAFRGQYSQWIKTIRKLQPDANIILGCLLPVGRAMSDSADCFSLEHLERMNELIRSLADDETIFYIEPGTVLADEDGFLPDEYSGDGLHLYPQYYELWAKFICEHPAGDS